MSYDVSVVKCENYDESVVSAALSNALNAIDGLDFVKPGMTIAIKANLVASKRPDTATTTHPQLVTALAKMLIERGASVIVGDSPGGVYNAAWLAPIYNNTGMKQVTTVGAKLNDDFSQVTIPSSGGSILSDFPYTAYLTKVDAIIDFAKLKTHGMLVMSAAVKNMFGTIPGTCKPDYHVKYPDVDKFAEMLIDLYEYTAPRLSIIDAVYGMEGNGPTAGTPRYIGALIASKSGHYADLVAASVIGLETERVPLLIHAQTRALCPASVSDLSVYGTPTDFAISDYNLISHANEANLATIFPKPLAALAKVVFRTRPLLNKTQCIGCKVCYNTCPKHAITMKNSKPVFDYKKCIRCFCCQEFCPRGALVVHHTLVSKIVNRL